MTDPASTPSQTYDLAILGAGSGGMAAARRARERGLSVVLFEGAAVGGTCVNAGCVPKKLLVHASRMRDALDDAPHAGWSAPGASFDWPALRGAVQAEVARLADPHCGRLIPKGVTLVEASGAIETTGIVRASDGRRFAAADILIATGAAPVVPDLPGADLTLPSDDIFEMETLPESLAIVGGGYIAAEFACMLRRFGVEVTIFQSGDRLLEGFDAESAERLAGAMRGQGIEVRTGVKVEALSQTAAGTVVRTGAGEFQTFERVLLAVGRRPATGGLGLGGAGVRLTDRGAIVVDDDRARRSRRPAPPGRRRVPRARRGMTPNPKGETT
jgi:glutathione reductase (NADPH)